VRLCEIVSLVGYALGGLPGERLLDRFGITSSDGTVLRRVKGRGGAIQPAVRVLSVDDWAWRKKQRYGTMLMDLQRSQVIDLLPERSADSFARWLGLHPEVEVIARDRSSLYAQRYTKVHELHQGDHTQPEIAEKVGMGAETVSRWLNAPAFPERRIRSDRRRDQPFFFRVADDCSRH
jgi:Transposase